MHIIMDLFNAVPLSEKRLFNEESKCNCKTTPLQVLQILLLLPCFMIKSAYNDGMSPLCNLYSCKKDKLYRFLSNKIYCWRKIPGILARSHWKKEQRGRRAIKSRVRFDCILADSWFVFYREMTINNC